MSAPPCDKASVEGHARGTTGSCSAAHRGTIRCVGPNEVVGVLLVSGLVVFLVGAARWRLDYEGRLTSSLAVIHGDRARRAWIHTWMIAGVLLTTSGLAGFSGVSDTQLSRSMSLAATVLYAVGAACWLAALAFRLTVVPWAAERAVADGAPPPAFVALNAWAGSLYLIHMFASYGAFFVLGGAATTSATLPAWVASLGLAFGVVGLLGLAFGGRYRTAFYPPFWAHTYTALLGGVLIMT